MSNPPERAHLESKAMTVNLGDKCRDTVTGYEGIATVRSEYISGCARIGVQGAVGADGKIPDAYYFDEPMLVVVERGNVATAKSKKGGPRDAPGTHEAPKR